MPYPVPSLYPSPSLFPGRPGPFVEQIRGSISPWDDRQGSWEAYNAAIATMFGTVFDIVADLGDPSQTIVATLSSGTTESVPITNLNVEAVSTASLSPQAEVTAAFGTHLQTFTVVSQANIGDTSIAIELAVPNFSYPIGTPIQLAYVPGWSDLLDPDVCPEPFLPFLAQFNGTPVPPGLDATTLRAKIISESAATRGTSTSIISAAQRNLISTKSVVLQERLAANGTADAYHFMLIVRPEEVVSLSALTNDVNLVKPGGVQWTLIQTDGWTISEMEVSELTLAAVEADFVTLLGLELDRPGT